MPLLVPWEWFTFCDFGIVFFQGCRKISRFIYVQSKNCYNIPSSHTMLYFHSPFDWQISRPAKLEIFPRTRDMYSPMYTNGVFTFCCIQNYSCSIWYSTIFWTKTYLNCDSTVFRLKLIKLIHRVVKYRILKSDVRWLTDNRLEH